MVLTKGAINVVHKADNEARVFSCRNKFYPRLEYSNDSEQFQRT